MGHAERLVWNPRIAGILRKQSPHVARDAHAVGQNPESEGTCPSCPVSCCMTLSHRRRGPT